MPALLASGGTLTMKLYAKVIGQRAEKGQGSNTFLTIVLYGDNEIPLGDILFTKCIHDEKCGDCRYRADIRVFKNRIHAEVMDYPDTKLPPYLLKGKKQKTTGKCLVCGQGSKDEPECDTCIFE